MLKALVIAAVIAACSVAALGQSRARRTQPRYTATACRPILTVPGQVGGVLNAKALSLPEPVYPPPARAVHAEGPVSVQVLVNEEGNVAAASAASGNPLLRASAVRAAKMAKFPPWRLGSYPVKISGIVTYNFVAPGKPKRQFQKKKKVVRKRLR